MQTEVTDQTKKLTMDKPKKTKRTHTPEFKEELEDEELKRQLNKVIVLGDDLIPDFENLL